MPDLTFKILSYVHKTHKCAFFLWISEQTAITSLSNINRGLFMTEKECVCFAVQTDYRLILYFRWLIFRAGEVFGNGRRGGCDVVHHSGGSQYTRDFSFTSVPLPTIFSKVANNFCHIRTSPNIVHE